MTIPALEGNPYRRSPVSSGKIDATYVPVREHRHVVSNAVVIATRHREVLGVDLGERDVLA